MPREHFTRRAVLACAASFIALFVSGAAPADTPPTVKLIVDYGDGVEKHFTLPWQKDMTVLDATTQAGANPHGIKFNSSGSGATAFLAQIDDVKNQGGGSGKKNWLYWLNDQQGKAGFGAQKLAAGDVARWKFAVYDPTQK